MEVPQKQAIQESFNSQEIFIFAFLAFPTKFVKTIPLWEAHQGVCMSVRTSV